MSRNRVSESAGADSAPGGTGRGEVDECADINSAAFTWNPPRSGLGVAARPGRFMGHLRLVRGSAPPRGSPQERRAHMRGLPRRGPTGDGAPGGRVCPVSRGSGQDGRAHADSAAKPPRIPQGRCGMQDVPSRASPLDRLVRAMSHLRLSGALMVCPWTGYRPHTARHITDRCEVVFFAVPMFSNHGAALSDTAPWSDGRRRGTARGCGGDK